MVRFAPFPADKSRKTRGNCLSVSVFLAVLCAFAYGPAAAHGIDLSSNPYIKTPSYKPPPLPPVINAPSSRQASGGSKADMGRPFNPPKIEYRPARAIDPGKSVNHDQWCRHHHPSYRPADNTYRPFDKGGTMPPQARIPCISPYGS